MCFLFGEQNEVEKGPEGIKAMRAEKKPGRAGEKTLCAWCGRVKGSNGSWEKASSKKTPRQTTHGICPECLASEMCAANSRQPRLAR